MELNKDLGLETLEQDDLDSESQPAEAPEIKAEPTISNPPIQSEGFREMIQIESPTGLKIVMGSNYFTTLGLLPQIRELLDYVSKQKENKTGSYCG